MYVCVISTAFVCVCVCVCVLFVPLPDLRNSFGELGTKSALYSTCKTHFYWLQFILIESAIQYF